MSGKGRKILVAVDEGEESAYALTWCLQNLHNPEDTLVLLYAIQPPAAPYAAMDAHANGYLFSSSVVASMERYTTHVSQSVVSKAKRICLDHSDQVTVETVVEHGDPRDVICEVAERLKVHFLVIGSRGYGLIKRAFLGSVSTHCAQNVKCPVMIVKKP